MSAVTTPPDKESYVITIPKRIIDRLASAIGPGLTVKQWIHAVIVHAIEEKLDAEEERK